MLLLLSLQTFGTIWTAIILFVLSFAFFVQHKVKLNTKKSNPLRMPEPLPRTPNKYGIPLLPTELKKFTLREILQFAQQDSMDLYHCLKKLELAPNHPMLMDQRGITENINMLIHWVDNPSSTKTDFINLTYFLSLQKLVGTVVDTFRPYINYQKVLHTLMHTDFQASKDNKTIRQLIHNHYVQIILKEENLHKGIDEYTERLNSMGTL